MNLEYFGIGHHPILELRLVVLDAHFNRISLFFFFFWREGREKRLVNSSDLIVTGSFYPMESHKCGPAPGKGGVAVYCHRQVLQRPSGLLSCLQVPSAPLP